MRLGAHASPRVADQLVRAVRAGYAGWNEVDAALSAEWPTHQIALLGRHIGERVRRRIKPLPAGAAMKLVPLSAQFAMPGFRATVRDVVVAGYGCGYVSGHSLRRFAQGDQSDMGSPAIMRSFKRCVDARRRYWKDAVAACVTRTLGRRHVPGAPRLSVEPLCNPDAIERDGAQDRFAVFYPDLLGCAWNRSLSSFDMPSLLRLDHALAALNEGGGLYLAPPVETAFSPFGYGSMIEDDLIGYLGEVDLTVPAEAVVLPRGMIEHLSNEYGLEAAEDQDAYRNIVQAMRFLRDRADCSPASDAGLHPAIKRFIAVLDSFKALRASVADGVEVSGDENGGPAALALCGNLSGFESMMLDDVYEGIQNEGNDWCSFYAAPNAARALDLALVDAWVITVISDLFENLQP